ncbi:unnamed protein product [Kuraishia capsulata CBS 1993]|uniref:Uncharacterized protein n=1 Tax=Kuraishia capsulata CBS 1993 TaxID=1382522 RepID=W6MQI0_9ASCO|nr:uncharacterized protein KUCA_T00004561001 [Kuraishia capsulata CBS 1993]CDK28578.1 unnamed protein product [Kuraishia capsulata CBS 1993]
MQKALVDSQKKNLCLAELRSLNLGLADQVSALSDSLIRLANNTKSRPHYYHNLRNTAERTWNAFVAVHHVITLIFNSPAYIMQMVKDRIFLKMLENLLEQKASHQREAAI